MPRIFVPPDCITGDAVELKEAEARRLARVLRMSPGDTLTVFDGTREHACRIETLSTKSAKLAILSSVENRTEPRINITLGQGMPKGEKLELVVQKAVELGVSRIVPVVMERSVKRPDVDTRKTERLVRIATEATQQSGRMRVPDVPPPDTLAGFLDNVEGCGLKLMFYEGERARSLRDVLDKASGVDSVAILVGPEGGLSPDEVALALSRGFVAAGLGPRILRTETAGIAALAVVQYVLGDIG